MLDASLSGTGAARFIVEGRYDNAAQQFQSILRLSPPSIYTCLGQPNLPAHYYQEAARIKAAHKTNADSSRLGE